MRRVVATGKTVDEAVTSALVRLGITRSQATIRVISEPVNRLFGILRSKDAEVEVTAIQSLEEDAQDYLMDILERMGLDAKVRLKSGSAEEEVDHTLEIVCGEDDLPVVIGRHGVTLDSLQYLVNTVMNRGQEKHVRFRIDAGDYRRKRREGLEQVATRALERAVRTGRKVVLESMPASERKLIHTYLQERPEVTTISEGAEPNRHVVVIPVDGALPRRDTRHRGGHTGQSSIERSAK